MRGSAEQDAEAVGLTRLCGLQGLISAVHGPSGRLYLPIDVTGTLLEVERFIRDRVTDVGGTVN